MLDDSDRRWLESEFGRLHAVASATVAALTKVDVKLDATQEQVKLHAQDMIRVQTKADQLAHDLNGVGVRVTVNDERLDALETFRTETKWRLLIIAAAAGGGSGVAGPVLIKLIGGT